MSENEQRNSDVLERSTSSLSSLSDTEGRPIPSTPSQDLSRHCWVCFASDEDDLTASWARPCRCKGTSRWVHQACLQRWVDEKQKGNSSTRVVCPQCNTEYIIVFPQVGPVVYILDTVDRIVYKVCPFMAAGLVVGSIYWTAVTYGAVTVMQVMGHKEGLNVMEQADPLFLLVGLPTIPVMLVLSKMVRWEDYLLRIWRKHSPKMAKIPILNHLATGESSQYERTPMEPAPLSDPVSATRVLCGALLLPTVATFCGKFFFEHVTSSLQKAVLGGTVFVAVKGALRMYYKQQQYVRQAQRTILDFDETLERVHPQPTSPQQ